MISAVIKYEDNRVSIHSSATREVGIKFSKGFYVADTDQNNNLIISEDFLKELHVPYATTENSLVLNTIESFFSPEIEAQVNALGFTHKLGVLLFGKAGTGKTSLLNFISKRLIEEKDSIVLFCKNHSTLNAAIYLAKMIREIQPNPIVFIADEFERYARDAESEMKNFLDGNESVSNTLFLAATNYIDKVPDTLKNRPSRFKVVLEIKGITDKKLMKQVLTNISNKINPGLFTKKEIDLELKEVKDVTLDEIKHMCLNKLTNNYLPKTLIRQKIGFAKNDINEDDDSSNPFCTQISFFVNKPNMSENNSNI